MFQRQVLILSVLFSVGVILQLYNFIYNDDKNQTSPKRVLANEDKKISDSNKVKISKRSENEQESSGFQQRAGPEEVLSRSRPDAKKSEIIPPRTPSDDQFQALQIKSLDSKWQWWPQTTAIHRSLLNGSPPNAFAEVEQRIVLDHQSLNSTPVEFYADAPMVLFDPGRKKVALLTGVFIVTAKSQSDLESLESDKGFEVVSSFSHLKVIFLKPHKNPFNLNEVAQIFAHDKRVQSFEYEILKGNLTKN